MYKRQEKYIGVKAEDVIVASTGVIGQPMTLEPFEKNFGKLADSLEDTPAGGTRAAEAIMTTDTVSKEDVYKRQGQNIANRAKNVPQDRKPGKSNREDAITWRNAYIIFPQVPR